MMDARRIEFIGTQTHLDWRELKDRFEYRTDKKHLWIQRICFWILRKIGAFSKESFPSFTKFTIDTRSFVEQLFRQKGYIIKEFNKEPHQLFIGAEDFAELMNSEEIRQRLDFNAEYYKNNSVMGLKVTIIPWLRGMVVI